MLSRLIMDSHKSQEGQPPNDRFCVFCDSSVGDNFTSWIPMNYEMISLQIKILQFSTIQVSG